jgi:hypothetical protein
MESGACCLGLSGGHGDIASKVDKRFIREVAARLRALQQALGVSDTDGKACWMYSKSLGKLRQRRAQLPR